MTNADQPDTGKYVSEQELNEKAVGPRVTLESIEDNIEGEFYFSPYDGVMGERFLHLRGEEFDPTDVVIPKSLRLTTYCVLILKNGFTVTGQSACAAPENYDEKIGRRVARGDAIRQIWPLMGFELRSMLASGEPGQEKEPVPATYIEPGAELGPAHIDADAEIVTRPEPTPAPRRDGGGLNPYVEN